MSVGLISLSILQSTADTLKQCLKDTTEIAPSEFSAKILELNNTQSGDFFTKYISELQASNSWKYAFAGNGWTDYTFTPQEQITINSGSVIRYLFYQSKISNITVDKIDFSNGTDWRNVFDGCKATSITLKPSTTAPFTTSTFSSCSELVNLTLTSSLTVDGLNLSDCTSLSFSSGKDILINIANAIDPETGVQIGEGLSVVLPQHLEQLIQDDEEAPTASFFLSVAVNNGWTVGFA